MEINIAPQTAIQQKPTHLYNARYGFIPHTTVDKIEITAKSNPEEKPVKMLLELLKSALNNDAINTDIFKKANHNDWESMLNFSNEASVTGIAADAADKLPKGIIPKDIIMKMVQVQREAEIRHGMQEKILGELSDKFAEKGIVTVQLKGIGLSMNYPEPTHRFGGDIDIFTKFKGTQTQGISNSYTVVDDIMANSGIDVEDRFLKENKHSEFNYKGVRIENHRYFLNKERIQGADILDDYLHKSLNPQEQLLPNGTKILVPSREFNSVFLAHHAYQHLLFGGIDLHHLTDWSAYIKNNGLQLPKEIKGTHFEKFTFALTNLSNRYLGTNVNVPEDQKFEDDIFKTMLHPENENPPINLNNAELILYKVKRGIQRTAKAKKYSGSSAAVKYVLNAISRKLQKPSELIAYK